MYCIIYQFEVKPGFEAQFIKAWEKLTLFYREECNSLGSRLHRESGLHYMAYAQWPNLETYEAAGSKENAETAIWSQEMREACTSVKALYKLEPIVDYLK
ncbi:MAG: antibiotic biosynthesis monooxygenase [Bacteroidetes bacterium]|nr:antibiotic biosynthesis monooxygenase [Bacteroidota bacterium]